MHNQGDIPEPQFLNKSFKKGGVIAKTILNVRLARLAKANQIDGDDMPMLCEVRDNVTPDVSVCWIAVQQENRVSISGLDIMHFRAANFSVSRHIREIAFCQMMLLAEGHHGHRQDRQRAGKS